ncbi:MAG TPA: NUDIX hydrolase [Nanoarchaeota archaeon]|nr:NUDIX hydrolase [Nanoarchaeota archaeon]
MAKDFDGIVAIVFRRGRPDKFVLVQNRKTGNVSFPSGAMLESEDSAADAMAREVRAQTGLKPEDYEAKQIPLGFEFVSYNGTNAERTRQVVFLVETLNTISAPEDVNFKIRVWTTADEIIQMLAVKEAKQLFEKAIKFIR